jgi:hypothetical protein
MPARKPCQPYEKPQLERFREAARELRYDDEAAFDEKLRQIAQHRLKHEDLHARRPFSGKADTAKVTEQPAAKSAQEEQLVALQQE